MINIQYPDYDTVISWYFTPFQFQFAVGRLPWNKMKERNMMEQYLVQRKKEEFRKVKNVGTGHSGNDKIWQLYDVRGNYSLLPLSFSLWLSFRIIDRFIFCSRVSYLEHTVPFFPLLFCSRWMSPLNFTHIFGESCAKRVYGIWMCMEYGAGCGTEMWSIEFIPFKNP